MNLLLRTSLLLLLLLLLAALTGCEALKALTRDLQQGSGWLERRVEESRSA